MSDNFRRYEPSKADYLPCCNSALVNVGEGAALSIFMINFCSGSLGTLLSAFLDGQGFNFSAFNVGLLQLSLMGVGIFSISYPEYG